jgi:hypothetical protein
MRVVVVGVMGRTPFAGVAWQVLHYLEGFRRLGWDVHYVEDTGDWPYDADRNAVSDDPGYTLAYIERLMSWATLADRWTYVAPDRRTFGLSKAGLSDLFASTDVLVNVTGGTVLRDEHMDVPVRVFLETDPGLPEIEVAQGNEFTTNLLDAHTHYFTYGESFGEPDCLLPVDRFDYEATRQPIVLDWWAPPEPPPRSMNDAFTTVTSWEQSGKDVEWNGETYRWSKHLEFLRFIDLPRAVDPPLELALASEDPAVIGRLTSHGWRVRDGVALSKDILPYRDYIFASHGEFTVAKDQYVRLRTGWFSDRSACYLAAGKPVITQDTGFGSRLPVGEGLFAFSDMDDILAAVDAIQSRYELHSRAAREIAEEFFSAENVVEALLQDAGVPA